MNKIRRFLLDIILDQHDRLGIMHQQCEEYKKEFLAVKQKINQLEAEARNTIATIDEFGNIKREHIKIGEIRETSTGLIMFNGTTWEKCNDDK